jgi:hypothetical protein
MEINDSDRLSTILHYVEAVYLSFDKDFSGTLNTDETLAAFDRFEGVIRQLASGASLDREGLRAVFTFLITHGKVPQTTYEKAVFLKWKWDGPRRWDLSVDRRMILAVFGKISESSKPKPGNPSIQAVEKNN